MRPTIVVRAFRGEHQFVAECLDLPVVTQGKTLDTLVSIIQEAISLHLDGDVANLRIVMNFELDGLASVSEL